MKPTRYNSLIAVPALLWLAALSGCDSIPFMGPDESEEPIPVHVDPALQSYEEPEKETGFLGLPKLNLDNLTMSSVNPFTEEESEVAKAKRLYHEGKVQEALHEFERILSERPTVEARMAYAKIQIDQGNRDEAQRQIQTVLAVDPGNPHAQAGMGTLMLDRGKLEEALSIFERALAADPDIADAHLGIGDIYKEWGGYALAAERYEEVVKLEPGSFEGHYKLGLMYQNLNRLPTAINAYLTALVIKPDSFKANLHVAAAYLQVDQPDQALPYAQTASQLDRRSQEAWANLGATYAALERYPEAVKAYKNAVEYGPLQEPIMLNLANALLKDGRYHQAANTLDALLRTNPSASGYSRMGYTLFKLRKFDDSLSFYERALDLDKEHIASLNGVGVNLMFKFLDGNNEDRSLRERALESWKKSIQIDPEQNHIVDLIARYKNL